MGFLGFGRESSERESQKPKSLRTKERLEKKRQRELEYLKKGTELYTARAKFKKAKHKAAHPFKQRPLITIKKKKLKGKIRLI